MRDERPSATAWFVALRRAAHQVLDHPRVFDDPLALPIVGAHASPDMFADEARRHTRRDRSIRAFMAVRSRVAEDALSVAVERGVRQYVVLGAGLDTFAYRNPFRDRLRVYEVDHPATQNWKRTHLKRLEIAEPPWLTFVPVDFESQPAFDGLRRAGFDVGAPAFFAWLGVTMYLDERTVWSVLTTIGGLPAPSGAVFDYAANPSTLGPIERAVFDAYSGRVAALGEPRTTFFDPPALEARMRALGFHHVHDLNPNELNVRYFKERSDPLSVGPLGHVVNASV